MLPRKLMGLSGARALALMVGLAAFLPVVAQDAPKGTKPKAEAEKPKALTNINNQLAAAAAVVPQGQGSTLLLSTDPVVIPRCSLAVIQKEEVPSQRDGVLLFIGTEIKQGETVPPGRLIRIKLGTEEKVFRELREGDMIAADQLLGQIDDRISRDDVAIAEAKVSAADADAAASEKTREETKARWDTAMRLSKSGQAAISTEDLRGAKLTYERYYQEAISKVEATRLARRELNKAQTIQDMHQIRSAIPGVIKSISRQKGESIKALEPVFQIQNLDRLRVEGVVDLQYRGFLEKGMQVVIEPSRLESPAQTMVGHLQEITGLAVSKDSRNPLIVSSSRDGTVRVWSRGARHAKREFRHHVPVLCVACTAPTATANLCITGAQDGTARIFDLDRESDQPIQELRARHRGAILSVAFSPDGTLCVTGGDDKNIVAWDVATGQMRFKFPGPLHRGAITSLEFTPQGQLVSCGQDGSMRLWSLSSDKADPQMTLEGRRGHVARLGVSPDGKTVFYDKDKELFLMALPTGATHGVLSNASSTLPFKSFALFSPDRHLALTAGEKDGRVQLWRLPTEKSRGYELRNLLPPDHSDATCAAFAPDGSFAVTGNQNQQIYVWPVPTKEEIEHQLTAEITFIDPVIESNGQKVKIWAELPNPGGRLVPGTTVNMVFYPRK